MPTLTTALAQGELCMNRVAENAGADFAHDAAEFILSYLATHGEASGEDLTDACVASGIKPHDLRAFGAVYNRLYRAGKIEKAGTCLRKKGHGTSGGTVWRKTV